MQIFKSLFYIISLGYVFVGIFFLDWSFRMVPFASNARSSDIALTIAIDSCYIAIGMVLFVATFLTIRNKKIGIILYRVSFWGGMLALISISISQAVISISQKLPSFYMGDIATYFILFVPAAFVFINHKKLVTRD